MSAESTIKILPRFYTNHSSGVGSMEYLPLGGEWKRVTTAEPLPIVDALQEKLETMMLYQIHWVESQFGLDVTSRLGVYPDFFTREEKVRQFIQDNVNLYSLKEWGKLKQEIPWIKDNDGFTVQPSNKVFVPFENNNGSFALLSHEFVHVLGGKRLWVLRELTDYGERLVFDKIFPGYDGTKQGQKMFDMFGEAMTELINVQMLHDMANDMAISIKPTPLYRRSLALLLLLVELCPDKFGSTNQEIIKNLTKGYFLANHDYLRDLRAAYGFEGLMNIGKITLTDMRDDGYKQVCELFGIEAGLFEAATNHIDQLISLFLDKS